ncbi:MAG: PAS domain S-box protein [Dehalococcoidia bacterium]|nr:PAS domain S-box protein [Dehalococcoidia bacterium]
MIEPVGTSASRFQEFVANVPAIICELSPDGTTLFVNETVTAITGYRPDELLGRKWWDDLCDEEQLRRVKDLYERFQQGDASDGEVVITAKDGAHKALRWRSANRYLSDGNPQGVVHFGVEVLERRTLAEENARLVQLQAILGEMLEISLRQISLEEQMDLILKSVVAIPWLALEAKGAIFLVDDSAETLTMKGHLGLSDSLLTNCATIPFGRCLCGRAAMSREVLYAPTVDDRHDTRPEGMSGHGHYCLPIISSGKLIGVMNLYLREGHRYDEREVDFLNTVTDVLANIAERKLAEDRLQQTLDELELRIGDRTRELVTANSALLQEIAERKRVEETLRESEQRYRTLFVLAGDALLTVLPAPGGIVDANEAATRLLGYSLEELKQLTRLEIVAPEALAENERRWAAQVAEKGQFLLETIWVRKDGTRVAVEVGGQPFALNGQTHFQLIARDMTERKQAEEELRRVQRLEMAGRIAGQVAHDFNNLLSPLTAYPKLIKLNLPKGHHAIALCDSMVESAPQMADINDDLLTLARRGRLGQEPTDLNKLVKQVISHILPKPETLTIRLSLAPDLLPIGGSPAQLLRVIANLCANAREAMHDDGQLEVRTGNIRADKVFGSFNRIETGEYVMVQVSDTGSGIPEEIRSKIFDPFFTTKHTDRKRGSGLGLSVVQVIVQDHLGHVDVESRVGTGTTFSVYLPVHRVAIIDSPTMDVTGGAETILVVDDDDLQRDVSGLLLQNLGYQIQAVGGREEALAYLKKHPVDVLMLDMSMPGMDGAETYRRALEIRPGQKAIAVSGYAETDRVQQALALGVSVYLRKPVTLQKLAHALRQALDRTE